MKKLFVTLGAAALAVAAGLFAGREPVPAPPNADERPRTMDLTAYADTDPSRNLRLLFIHHSCGGQLFAPPGAADTGEACIYDAAENGGGLRPMLEAAGYEVHEASYHSKIGHDTDTFHWLPKFRDQMQDVLRVDHQDRLFDDDRRHDIVMFKSCYPNNVFVGAGTAPGAAEGPALTVENAKATFRALLPIFEAHPERLFVLVTTPPKVLRRERLLKALVKKAIGRTTLASSGVHARAFNRWLVDDEAGWLAGYEGRNVAVFDYYDVLTGYGESNFSVYGSGPDGMDDHPSRAGNQVAAKAFKPFLNRAVHRAGLAAAPTAQAAP